MKDRVNGWKNCLDCEHSVLHSGSAATREEPEEPEELTCSATKKNPIVDHLFENLYDDSATYCPLFSDKRVRLTEQLNSTYEEILQLKRDISFLKADISKLKRLTNFSEVE